MTVPFASFVAKGAAANLDPLAAGFAADDLEILVRALQAAEFDRTARPLAEKARDALGLTSDDV